MSGYLRTLFIRETGDFMRYLAPLISIFFLLARSTNAIPPKLPNGFHIVQATGPEQKVSTVKPLQFLLTSAATDFHIQHPSHTLQFRKVRIGHVMTPAGEKQYMLCGQFQTVPAEAKAKWTPFLTIKTSGYEQWLGEQVASRCKQPSIIWEKGDQTTSLQRRFDSLP
jgi:hypothetical protein